MVSPEDKGLFQWPQCYQGQIGGGEYVSEDFGGTDRWIRDPGVNRKEKEG